MTLVSCIKRIRHPGVIRDFSWTTDLFEFGRYNLIYGWNGSGKTTISRLFRALERRTAPANGGGHFHHQRIRCQREQLQWCDTSCAGLQSRLRHGERLPRWRR